jgi:hypothetical protein
MAKKAGFGEWLPKEYIRDSVCHACHALMAESSLTDFFSIITHDEAFLRKVTYARAYYLNENEMAEVLYPSATIAH